MQFFLPCLEMGSSGGQNLSGIGIWPLWAEILSGNWYLASWSAHKHFTALWNHLKHIFMCSTCSNISLWVWHSIYSSSSSAFCFPWPHFQDKYVAFLKFCSPADKILKCSASSWASSIPTAVVFGVNDRRQRKVIEFNKANCLVWRSDVPSRMAWNWWACVYLKIWMAMFKTAEMFDKSEIDLCFPCLPPVFEYRAITNG